MILEILIRLVWIINLDIATLACEIKDKNELNKKNIVKVYTDNKLSSTSASKAITFFKRKLVKL